MASDEQEPGTDPVDSAPEPASSSTSDDQPPSWRTAALEIALALAVGIGLSYGFRALWSWQPYAAAIAAPICVCLAVALVASVRSRGAQSAMPFGVLLLVVFVITVLVTLPAAWELAR